MNELFRILAIGLAIAMGTISVGLLGASMECNEVREQMGYPRSSNWFNGCTPALHKIMRAEMEKK